MEHDQSNREPKRNQLIGTVIAALPYFITTALLLGLIIAIALVVIGGYIYRWEWTGFIGHTLWDWMKLLIVPIILALGGLLITQMERLNATRAQRIDADRLALEHEQAREDRLQAQEQLRLTREGQITERFTRTIDQLGATDVTGNRRIELRVGAIYALEQISRESEEYYWPIMEILTSYVRQHATDSAAPDPDIEAILTVLGRRIHAFGDGEPEPLDLHGTDLRRANFKNANLSGANLERANLESVDLRGANLSWADLSEAKLPLAILVEAALVEADLSEAYLVEADLSKADLTGANLSDANLRGARLDEAILEDADLTEANLIGTDLPRANLSDANLSGIKVRGATNALEAVMPDGALLPHEWHIEDWLRAAGLSFGDYDPRESGI